MNNNTVCVGKEELTADHILIASGGEPNHPEFEGN